MTPTTTPTTTDDALRVIAVGLSGRERSLRAPGVEIVRTRTGFEALGELGLPIDDASPRRTVVVLESRAVEPGDIPELADAMRRIQTSVRVVVLDGAAEIGERARAAVDSVVGPEIELADLTCLFESTPEASPRPPAPMPASQPATESTAEPAPAPPPVATAPAPEPIVPDTPATVLLQSILSGRDLTMAYLDRLASTEWGDQVVFVDTREGLPRPAQDAQRAVIDVAHRSNRFGWLIGPAAAEARLRGVAPELALCIAVQRQQEQLRDSAFRDHLTGAWNRRYFERYLHRCLEDARSRRRDLTLLLFDVDDFKHYNDAYGHAAGDEILVETVRLLRAVTRPSDEVCRIGGDEFAVIFYEPEGPREPGSTPPRSIFSIAHRFRQQICAHKFPKLGEQAKGRLTISGGLATFPWDGGDAESLIEHADRLLMQSKGEGKNVICLGPGAMRVCGPTGPQNRPE